MFWKRSFALTLVLASSVGVVLAAPLPASAQTFGGNELVSWTIPGTPTAGLDTVTFPMTVSASTAHENGTYFAQQYDFTGGAMGYTGLQPRIDANGRTMIRGVFSTFTGGSTTTDPNCHPGADGGPGVSCGVEFPTTYGRGYDVVVERIGTDQWSGRVVDTTTGTSTHIGTYRLPSGSGGLRGSQAGFVEYYDVKSCAEQHYYDVVFGAPRSGPLRGIVEWQREYGECAGYGHTDVNPVGDGVQIARGAPTDLSRRTIAQSAVRGPNGITVKGWARPGTRITTTNDPSLGWFDPEGGRVTAGADGYFEVTTRRSVDGRAVVQAQDPVTDQGIAVSNAIVPRTTISSAAWTNGWIRITGWAEPGSRIKTTNDEVVGWFDPERGAVYADASGAFTLDTHRSLHDRAAVHALDAATDASISQSNRVAPR